MTQPAATANRRVSPLSIALGILGAIIFILFSAAGIYTDWLWFENLGYEVVFFTEIIAQLVAFLVGFTIMAIIVAVGLTLAWKTRPIYIQMSEESPFAAYQQLLESLRKVVMFGTPAVLGLFGGLVASREWQTALLWLNGGEFGTTDPHFGLDAGFFVFDLPFFVFATGYISGAILLAALINAAVHFIYGGIRVTGRDVKVSKPARIQLAIFVAVYLIIQGVSLWLDQYSTAVTSGSLFTGVNYTDANAVIPGLQILGFDLNSRCRSLLGDRIHRSVANFHHRDRTHGCQLTGARWPLPMDRSDLPGGSKRANPRSTVLAKKH